MRAAEVGVATVPVVVAGEWRRLQQLRSEQAEAEAVSHDGNDIARVRVGHPLHLTGAVVDAPVHVGGRENGVSAVR